MSTQREQQELSDLIAFLQALAQLRQSGYLCNAEVSQTLQAIEKKLREQN